MVMAALMVQPVPPQAALKLRVCTQIRKRIVADALCNGHKGSDAEGKPGNGHD
jgi:hypothetical protein